MKVGIGSYTYPWNVKRGMTAAELLDEAIALDAQVLQLCDNLECGSIDWNGLAARAKDHGIELQNGAIGGPQEAMESARIAAEIGSKLVRFVIGQAFVAQSLYEVAEGLKDAAKGCEQSGARLAIENHDFFRSDQIAEIVHLIGHGCAVTLDTANSLSNLEGTDTIVHHLGEHTICLHAKDVVVEREFHMYGFRVFGVQAGKGMVDFQRLKEKLPKLESVILEQWTPTMHNQPPVELEKQLAGPGLAYLKSVWPS